MIQHNNADTHTLNDPKVINVKHWSTQVKVMECSLHYSFNFSVDIITFQNKNLKIKII